jgi:hypothetical protein
VRGALGPRRPCRANRASREPRWSRRFRRSAQRLNRAGPRGGRSGWRPPWMRSPTTCTSVPAPSHAATISLQSDPPQPAPERETRGRRGLGRRRHRPIRRHRAGRGSHSGRSQQAGVDQDQQVDGITRTITSAGGTGATVEIVEAGRSRGSTGGTVSRSGGPATASGSRISLGRDGDRHPMGLPAWASHRLGGRSRARSLDPGPKAVAWGRRNMPRWVLPPSGSRPFARLLP